MWTIWGRADHQQPLADGIWIISTPSHGGLVFTQKAAEQLSPACLAHGTYDCGHVFFEEDLDFMFPLFELPELASKLFSWPYDTPEAFRQHWIEQISAYDPDFLTYHGVCPTQAGVERYLLGLIEQYMRDHRHPELVISTSAWRATGLEGIGIAQTADGQRHLVDLEQCTAHHASKPLLLRDIEFIVPPAGL